MIYRNYFLKFERRNFKKNVKYCGIDFGEILHTTWMNLVKNFFKDFLKYFYLVVFKIVLNVLQNSIQFLPKFFKIL